MLSSYKQVIIQNALYRTYEREREQRKALQRLDTLADIPDSKIPEYVPVEKPRESAGFINLMKQLLP